MSKIEKTVTINSYYRNGRFVVYLYLPRSMEKYFTGSHGTVYITSFDTAEDANRFMKTFRHVVLSPDMKVLKPYLAIGIFDRSKAIADVMAKIEAEDVKRAEMRVEKVGDKYGRWRIVRRDRTMKRGWKVVQTFTSKDAAEAAFAAF